MEAFVLQLSDLTFITLVIVSLCSNDLFILYAANPPDIEEAIKWLYKASIAGYVRAQYQLALCLHKGRGPSRDLKEAV